MSIAAYNRGSNAMREQFDRESESAKYANVVAVGPWVREPHLCQRCRRPIGVRLDRGCAWDRLNKRWIDACYSCKRAILRDGHI
jgi:hypothetical protein